MTANQMTTNKKVMIVLVALLGALVLWTRFLGGLRGDETAVVEAEEQAVTAEQNAEAAKDANQNAATEAAARAGSVDQMVRFVEQLPEIAVEHPQALDRWYEQTLMTPAELVAYNSGDSAELISFSAPAYFANNPSCYVDDGQGHRTFAFEVCGAQADPTVVIGRSEVGITLSGWNSDCRAAHGWLFSRFFEAVEDHDSLRPSGHHTKPWILPGSFAASVTQCLNAAQIDALRRHIDVAYTDWPIAEDAWESGQVVLEAGDDSAPSAQGASSSQVAVTVQFTLLFRPAHSLLCVPNLAGYLEDADDSPAACPALPLLEALEAQRVEFGPRIPQRVCLPRVPIATAVPDGDQVAATFDADGWPVASGEWPADLDECSITPLPRPALDASREGTS